MAQEMESSAASRAWSERIDSVAAQFVLGEAASVDSMAESLAWMRQQADQAGWDEIARLASRIHDRMKASPQWYAEGPMADGLEKLRRAIEAATAPKVEPAKPVNTLAQDAGLVNDFILETREHLTSIENDLLTLDREPAQPEALHSLFRSFHTVKGLAGFLEFDSIRALAHEVETILDLARNHQMHISARVIDVVLESADYLKHEMNRLEAELGGAPPSASADVSALIVRVQALNTPGGEEAEACLAPPAGQGHAVDAAPVVQARQAESPAAAEA
ncbi:MAG: Hpt domain-containing protein, partial [Acidobacteria bacterium]|nr:Hpt domain-containing protein [Acidobacteriota bacterium]